MITVEVNGVPRELAAGTTLAGLIEVLGLRPELVAIELNRALVTRSKHGSTELAGGDRVELVTLVGGG